MMSASQDRTIQGAADILRNGDVSRRNGSHYRYDLFPGEEEEHFSYSPTPPGVGNPSIQMSDGGVCSSTRVPFSRRRRLFCLLTVFDFLMLVVLWFIYSQFLGLEHYGFKCQVENYDFRTSMFDIALLAFWRMVFLLLVYGLIRSDRWYAVGLSTLVTCGLIIAKTVLYDFSGKGDIPGACRSLSDARFADVFLLIASFIIVWFELFILDFQVIKSERRLNAARMRQEVDGETSPLLGSNQPPSTPPTHLHRKHHQQFYSPFDSPADSEDEDDQYSGKESYQSDGAVSAANFGSLPNSQKGSSINLAASLQEQQFLQKSDDVHAAFERLVDEDHQWAVVKTIEAATISTLTHDVALSSIIFKLEASFPVPAERLFRIMWDEFESSASWNKTVQRVEVVQEIGSDLQVVYSITNSLLVSSRDFVSIRQHTLKGETHLVSDVSIEHSAKPVTKDLVRGEHGISGWVIEPENPERCRLCWIVNTDIKLKLCPKNLFRQVFCNSLGEIYQGLTKALGTAQDEQSLLEIP